MKLKFNEKVEFYITNVCNYTCDNCNRFNNHKFSGWQRWSDYEGIYRQWAERIELRAITILGGEPTLNPTLPEWVAGLNEIFNCDVEVLTNGTRLNHVPELYKAITKPRPRTRPANHIGVSLHNIADFEMLRQNILNFIDTVKIEFGFRLNIPPPPGWDCIPIIICIIIATGKNLRILKWILES
jgi:organic radical activating enzyme